MPEMFQVYNMGVGFCVLAAERDAAQILAILERHGRAARVIGHVVADDAKGVHLPRQRLAAMASAFADCDRSGRVFGAAFNTAPSNVTIDAVNI